MRVCMCVSKSADECVLSCPVILNDVMFSFLCLFFFFWTLPVALLLLSVNSQFDPFLFSILSVFSLLFVSLSLWL